LKLQSPVHQSPSISINGYRRGCQRGCQLVLMRHPPSSMSLPVWAMPLEVGLII
jgi:hypothetical protein